jgi:hypothetical protein
MKVGIILSKGIGDIVIALPIAKYLADRGHRVLWPIPEELLASFVPAAPYVNFFPLRREVGIDRMYELPHQYLSREGCDRIMPLYHYFSGRPEIVNQTLARSLKFDEYKYAVTGVPFSEKWNLNIARDRDREQTLFRQLVIDDRFVVCHLKGSKYSARLDFKQIAQGRQIIEITERTNNLFDWLAIIEQASLRVMIDSCFANLTDQLRVKGPKVFLLKSPIGQTPVLQGDWDFMPPFPYVIAPNVPVEVPPPIDQSNKVMRAGPGVAPSVAPPPHTCRTQCPMPLWFWQEVQILSWKLGWVERKRALTPVFAGYAKPITGC